MSRAQSTVALSLPPEDRIAARRWLAKAFDVDRDAIAAAWLEVVGEEARALYPDLDRYLRSLVSGLYEVFRDDQWTLTQTIIDGLAERRARTGVMIEHGIQRALLAGRHAIRPFIEEGEPTACNEVLLDALHECVFRFSESYQGIQLSSENDRLHTRIIKSLIMALEARDPYTKGHSISVALLAQKIAAALGTIGDQQLVYLTGLLHDVGKVGIPDRILMKPGPLSDSEWEVMRSHPSLGAGILRPIKLYPDVIAAVLAHHENMDGSGYPAGLSGTGIHPIARIIRVADSFDAMTSTRVHRSGRSIDAAIEELFMQRGTVYDPDVVEALVDITDTPGAMRDLSLASLQIDLGEFAI